MGTDLNYSNAKFTKWNHITIITITWSRVNRSKDSKLWQCDLISDCNRAEFKEEVEQTLMVNMV